DVVPVRNPRPRGFVLGQERSLLGPQRGGHEDDEQENPAEPHAPRPPEASCASGSDPARLRRQVTTSAKSSAAISTPWASSVSTVGNTPSTGTRGAPATGVRATKPPSCSSKTPRPAKTIAIR